MKLRKIGCFLMAFVMLIMMLPAASAEVNADVQANIREMINCYRRSESGAANSIQTSLDTLTALDPKQGEAWRKIMGTWEWVNSTMELQYNVLPDGLPEDDSFGIVVMGYGLNPDGTMKEELRSRLTVALNSARKYPNAYVICTGGGTARDSDNTEAGVMAAWLLDRGISVKRIIVENKSYSTAQNALNTYNILVRDYPNIRSIAVVTSDYHIYRSYMNFVAVSDCSVAEKGTAAVDVVAHACCWPGYNGYESIDSQAYDIAHIADVDLYVYEEDTPSKSWSTAPAVSAGTQKPSAAPEPEETLPQDYPEVNRYETSSDWE